MKNKLLTLTLTGIILGATGMAQAQDIPQRKAIQQGRIANGVKNGSLTPNEPRIWRAEKQESTGRPVGIVDRTAGI